MLDGLVPEPPREYTVVKSFKIRPSDWTEVERVATLYNIPPTTFVRRLLLLGLDAAKAKLTAG